MPQLAPTIEKLEDVAEPVRQFYVARDGKYALDLAGAPTGFVPAADLSAANSKVIDFRDNNVKLLKEVEELRPLKTKFDGLDADAARAALKAQEELTKKGIKTPDDLTNVLKSAIDAAVKPLTDQITAITTTAQESQKRADAMTLRQTLGSKFVKAGGVEDATDYIVNKAQGVFKVVDGKVVAEANQFSADKPGELITVDEWLTRQTKESSFAFKPSGGSGAQPVVSGGHQPPAGQIVIKDPSPQQLGEYGDAARKGKVRFEYTNQ